MEWCSSRLEKMIGAAMPSDSSDPIPHSPRPLCQFQSSVDGMSGHSGSADGDGDSELGAFGMDRSEDEGLTGDSTATLESEAEERSPASTTDCLVSSIAPRINKQVEDALKPLLSVLRGVEEDERKHQEKLLAIEKRKLALENEKIQFFTRHGAPSWDNLLISQPQVRFANAASAPDQPVKDEAEEKGVSAKPSSRSDGSLQPPKLSSTVTKDKTPDDENLPTANKLVAFPDVGFCHSDKSNEGDHSSEGGHSHSDKKLPKLEKVIACSNVTSCLFDDSNAGEFSDKLKDHNLSEGDHSHSVDLPKLVFKVSSPLQGLLSSSRFCSSFSLLSHPQRLATRSEVVMQDTTARDTDMTTMTSEPVKSKRGACGKELNPALAKRRLTPTWTDDEKHALLMLKLEASVRGGEFTEGATWNVFVSITLKERHGFDRAPMSCKQQSDTLKEVYDAIRMHDANALGTVGGMSYWKMKDQEREALKLPHGFYFGWYVLIESMTCSYSQEEMAESDGCILPRVPFASAEPGESDPGLLSGFKYVCCS